MRKLRLYLFQILPLISTFIFTLSLISCKQEAKKTESTSGEEIYQDIPFVQEIHDAYMVSNNQADNEVRSIAVDHESNVWIATASGVFLKKADSRVWDPVITDDDRGPAYSVTVNPDGDVLPGTWDGIYRYRNHSLNKEEGYLENVSHLNSKNPAWQIYFYRTMEGYLFPILLKYEKDPQLNQFYNKLINEWMDNQPAGENLINNLTYALALLDGTLSGYYSNSKSVIVIQFLME
ncbi:MAG: hypothetical protein Q7T72_13085 [Bacteroidales bacterium]|nr:hypothetical protein [Bacteroidales bacterium]